MKAIDAISENLEHAAEDIEYLRHGCEVVGLKEMADHLASLARDLRHNIAAMRTHAKPKRARTPKLVVNNAKH